MQHIVPYISIVGLLAAPASLQACQHLSVQGLTCKSCGAQVRSRFVPEDGNQEDYRPFLQAMGGLGFQQKNVDYSNSHFVTFELQRQKLSADIVRMKWPELRACTYKKR